MSTMDYLAGVAAESNLRSAEISSLKRAHSAEINTIISKAQLKIDELYDENTKLIKKIESMEAAINQGESLIKEKDKQIFNRELRGSKHALEAFMMENEVQFFIDCTLDEIIEAASKKAGIQYGEDFSEYIKLQSRLALEFSYNTFMRKDFISGYGREIFNTMKECESKLGDARLIDKIVELANKFSSERKERLKAYSREEEAEAYEDRIIAASMAKRISFQNR